MIKARDFDETTDEVMNYLVEGVYPTSVSGIEYSSSDIGAVQEFTVTLTYYRFLSGNTSGTYDDIDNFLDTFGRSAQSYSSSGIGIGSIDDLYSKATTSFSSVSSALGSLSDIF